MKKLSISLFALLAIVFAVTSAFTSKSAKSPFAVAYFVKDVPAGSSTAASSYDETTPIADINDLPEGCELTNGVVCASQWNYSGSQSPYTLTSIVSNTFVFRAE